MPVKLEDNKYLQRIHKAIVEYFLRGRRKIVPLEISEDRRAYMYEG